MDSYELKSCPDQKSPRNMKNAYEVVIDQALAEGDRITVTDEEGGVLLRHSSNRRDILDAVKSVDISMLHCGTTDRALVILGLEPDETVADCAGSRIEEWLNELNV